MAAQCAASAAVAPTGLAAVLIGLLGVVCAAIGVRLAYAFSFTISDAELELRFAFHTTNLPLEQVVDCRPDTRFPKASCRPGSSLSSCSRAAMWSPSPQFSGQHRTAKLLQTGARRSRKRSAVGSSRPEVVQPASEIGLWQLNRHNPCVPRGCKTTGVRA